MPVVPLKGPQWERLLDALELSEGFVFLGVDVGNVEAQEAVLAGLEIWAQQHHWRVIAHPVSLDDPALAVRSVLASPPQAQEMLVLTVPQLSVVPSSPLNKGLQQFFALFNQKRDELARRSQGPLILVLHALAWKVVQQRASDLFSIYQGIFRIDPIKTTENPRWAQWQPLSLEVHPVAEMSLFSPLASVPKESPRPRLIGRDQELRFLRVALSEPGAMVLVVGAAGMGKTALLDYMAQEKDLGFTKVVRVNLDGDDAIFNAQGQVIHARYPAAPITKEVAGALYAEATQSTRVLILADDVMDEATLTALRPSSPSVLLAASQQNFQLTGLRTIRLNALLNVDALTFLTSERAIEDPEEQAAAQELLEYMGGYPPLLTLWRGTLAQDDNPQPYQRLLTLIQLIINFSLNQEGLNLYNQGDFTGAQQRLKQALASQTRILGPEHPDTLATLQNLAVALHDQGDLTGARERYEQVLAAQTRILGSEHPSTLNTLQNLALTLHAQGDLTEARQHLEQALDAQTRILGPEHSNTLNTLQNLAMVLHAQGDLTGARQHLEQALTAQTRILGPEHPNTLSMLQNLAMVLHAQGDLTGAQQRFEQALTARTRLLGPEHPNTLTTLQNLAMTLRSQGDLTGAQQRFEQALAAQIRILGPEHPNTLTTLQNLALTLGAQGDLAGAQQRLEQALAAQIRILGPDHPNTTLTRFNLMMLLKDTDPEAAKPHLQILKQLADRPIETLSAQEKEILAELQTVTLP